jgi:hypothetical protein
MKITAYGCSKIVSGMFSLVLLFHAKSAFSWGERGHDLVTRVAARLVHESLAQDPTEFGNVLLSKEHMLGHLSNVPDIVWRNGEKHVIDANSPTHFVDLEFLYPASKKPTKPNELPASVNEMRERLRRQCSDPKQACPKVKGLEKKIAKTGTAPFRIDQLYGLLVDKLKVVSTMEKPSKQKVFDEKLYTNTVNEALTLAGLLSHFVADLANPHHASMNYDGWLSGQGGIHSFFETKVVNEIDLNLDHKVYVMALKNKPFQSITPNSKTDSVLDLSWRLALDSNSNLERLNSIDRSHALLLTSKDRVSAKRKAPEKVIEHFQDIALERLALASDALATLWLRAWHEAGKPGLEAFKSYEYPLTPGFIEPSYLRP